MSFFHLTVVKRKKDNNKKNLQAHTNSKKELLFLIINHLPFYSQPETLPTHCR